MKKHGWKREDDFTDLITFDKEAYFKKMGGEEVAELSMFSYGTTGYPTTATPEHRKKAVIESYTRPVEETYFWLLAHLTEGRDGYASVEKTIDTFASAEQSSFWGQSMTRLGAQQEKVSQYLATIGKMIKDMFQLVRELRILDERISYYKDSMDAESKSRDSAEITLKGIYVDMAEGGSKNPSSVFGLAREVQFTILPDLFFSTHPTGPNKVDEVVDALDFNKKVKEVLKRKLRSYLEWRKHTFSELNTRRMFTLRYTRQHYDVIHLYLSWIRPYLRNIARLQSENLEQNKEITPHLVSAFEGSLMEVEFLAKKFIAGNTEVYAVIIENFVFRTRPAMSFQQEGYRHQGPIHVGKVEVTFRCYAWTQEEIDNYKRLRAAEDFETIGKIDRSVREAMEGLGKELEKYLVEAGEEHLLYEREMEKKETPKKGIFKDVRDTFIRVKPKEKVKRVSASEKKKNNFKIKKEKGKALRAVHRDMWTNYKNYKKAFGFLAW